MATYANAVITKARSMYGHMLTREQYAELARKQNLQEISAYLREKTHFAKAMEDVRDSIIYRRQLETLLRQNELYQYTRLVHYVGEKNGVYSQLIMNREIELILNCLREFLVIKSENYLSELPTFIQPYIGFDVLSLAQVKSMPQLIKLLERTPYADVLRRCWERLEKVGSESMVPYAVYEFALRKLYFTTMLQRARAASTGKARRELEELLITQAELMNIAAVYRLKTYFHLEPVRIREQLFPFYGKISEKNFERLVEAKDSADFLQLLQKTPFGRDFDPANKSIEEQAEHIRYKLDVRMLRFSTDPQVVYTAYMLLCDMETENVIRIIEGVHYGLAPEKIEGLLYGVGA